MRWGLGLECLGILYDDPTFLYELNTSSLSTWYRGITRCSKGQDLESAPGQEV